MKRAARIRLRQCLLGAALAAGAWGARAWAEPPSVEAKAAVLVDAATGAVLYQRGMHERRPMASTTKVMTALIALERCDPEEWVRIGEGVRGVTGSALYLEPGERMQMKDLLAALLLRSANDGAVAVAEHVSGSVDAFARLMNQRAQELGARNTHFVNPHGLHEPDHYSSAYDLALITREAMKHPLFRELVSTRWAEVWRPDTNGTQVVRNHNHLLWRADFVDGVKTGYVRQAGRCLVASGSEEDWQLIAVVLDSPDPFEESLALLQYGFARFRRTVHARAGDALGRAPVSRGRSRWVAAVCEGDLAGVVGPQMEEGRVEVALEEVEAPVAAGQRVGEARLVVGGRTVATSALVAGEPVAEVRWLAPAVWALRVLGFVGVAALMLKTHGKLVKGDRRSRRHLPAQGGGAGPRGPGPR